MTNRSSSPQCFLSLACAIIVLCIALASTASAQTLNNLFVFESTHGAMPQAALIQATDGNFYGTTARGGLQNSGTVFRMTPDGSLTTIYSFCSQTGCTDGKWPSAALLQGQDGNFYGTTTSGGDIAGGWGTVFKIASDGTFTSLHRFLLTDGVSPRGALVQGSDGSFYGTTYEGGVNNSCPAVSPWACGTIFKITSDGTFTTLYNFCSLSNCADGANPVGGLLLAKDGNFYGTTYTGGSSTACSGPSGCGTVFQFTPGGTLTTLHSFCSESNCTDGMFPNAALIQGADGNLYGTAQEGGARVGTVFKITPSGRLTTLYTFCSQTGCVDGGEPGTALVQGKDKNFYGTTNEDGAHGQGGTVFKLSPSGQFTTLYSFCARGVFPNCRDGEFPNALVQGRDGNFYGTAQGRSLVRCTNYCGTIFRFGTHVALQPSSGPVGQKIVIIGLNLTGATIVRFNGVPATFVPVSATKLRATVPNGAKSGSVKVTTPGGVLTSTVPFTVTP